MENQAVIERFLFLLAGFFVREFLGSLGESNEICHRLRCFHFEQAHHNIPLGSFEYGVGSCRSAHAVSLCIAQSYTTVSTPRHFGRRNKKVCELLILLISMTERYQPFCLRSSVMCAV